MNEDKKNRRFLVPFIFMILLFVPMLLIGILPESMNTYTHKIPEVIRYPFAIMLVVSMLLGGCIYMYIPLGVYIAMHVVYTVISWIWMLRQKKGNVLYFIVWLVLCVLSILMYWWGGSTAEMLLRQ